MKTTVKILCLTAGLLLVATTMRLLADDAAGKEGTLTGTMVCGKCTLHLTKTCQNVVQVEQDGKIVNYYVTQNDVSKAAHDPICDSGNSEKVTVTGTVVEQDGKEVLTASKIEVAK